MTYHWLSVASFLQHGEEVLPTEIQMPYLRLHKKILELLAKKYASLTAAALVCTDTISRQYKL